MMDGERPFEFTIPITVKNGIGKTVVMIPPAILFQWSCSPPLNASYDLLGLNAFGYPIFGVAQQKGVAAINGIQIPINGQYAFNVANADTDGTYALILSYLLKG